MTDRDKYELNGWANGLLGQAYDLIDVALQEYSDHKFNYELVKKLRDQVESVDYELEQSL